MKTVILERNSVGEDVSVESFRDFGELVTYSNTVGAAQTKERIADADIVIMNKVPINEETLKDAKNVKIVAFFATGFDSADLEYCRKRNIAVCNVASYCTEMVAQHTFALALSLSEHLAYYDNYVKDGSYAGQDRFSHFGQTFTELAGKVWGIAGMGNIGRKVAQIAEAFGCKVIFYSASGNSTCTDYERVELDELLAKSDIVSLHCPLTDKTRNLIDKEALSKMKKSAILINVARGKVVNNKDLAEALNNGIIAAAGLDVVENEPIEEGNPLNEIKDSNKLIITPHMAWASYEARERCVSETYKNIQAFFAGEKRNRVEL